jgi:HK97 family phage major capsid protein
LFAPELKPRKSETPPKKGAKHTSKFLFLNNFSCIFVSTFAPMVRCHNCSKRDVHDERRASQKPLNLEGIIVPKFEIDPRVDRKKLLHARKLNQKLHRDAGVKYLTEIAPHKLEWGELAKLKREATRACADLLESVADDASETRAAEIESAFDIVNELTKNVESEMNYRDDLGQRGTRNDPFANDAIGQSSRLAADGITWVSSEDQPTDNFALRADEPMRSYAKPKAPYDERGLGIGNMLSAMVNGPQNDAEKRALAEGSDSTGGFNVPAITSNQLIDNLRANLVVNAAGARVVPLSSDSTTIAKIASDPVAEFRAEAGLITESDPTFSAITFVPRSLAVMVKASREVLEDANNINEAMQGVLSRSMAAKVDQVALEGTGVAPEPTGLRNQSGIGATALDAALTSYAPFVNARTGIQTANGGPITAMILHPRDEGVLSALVDSTGQPLNPPPAIANIPLLTTSALQTDAGSGNNESNAYVGNFQNLLIGLRNDVRVEVLRERYAENHQYAFIAHMRFDLAIAHAASFHKIIGITG